jgi:hypothetical protein
MATLSIDDWHLEGVVSAIRSAALDPDKPEVADALATAIANQQGRERVLVRKRQQEETAVAARQEEEAVLTGLHVELQALRGTDPGMTLLTAVESVTSDPGHRIALYRLCSRGDRNIRSNGVGQDDSRPLKIAALVANDLAFLERRAKAEGFQDETRASGWEGSKAGPASIRSPLPHTQDRNPRKALLDRQGMGSDR